MLQNPLELNDGAILQIRSLDMMIQAISDSGENLGAESAEEEGLPAIQNLHQELMDPYNDMMKESCDAAIASYISALSKESKQEENSIGIERLQQEVVNTLKNHLVQEHRMTVIDDCRKPCTCCYIIPPYILQKVHQVDHIRENVFIDQGLLSSSEKVKGRRSRLNGKVRDLTSRVKRQSKSGNETPITVYDAHHGTKLPGTFVASNEDRIKASKKDHSSVKKVLKSARNVHQFWLKNFNVNSYDGKGSEIKSTIHYGKEFPNAFWNGEQMVFGDGNDYFQDLTQLSIVGHEFGHAITGNKLNYEGEAGALNEHLSDVWGSLTEQFKNKQTVEQASWLIGEETIHVGSEKFPLRSMKDPGNAYDSPVLGKDPQPNHYSERYKGQEDLGGVHINSGIPNRAFYLFALAQGGYAWEKAGHLWYLTMMSNGLIHPDCNMHEFAQATIYTALQNFPTDYKMHQDLVNAWRVVGLA